MAGGGVSWFGLVEYQAELEALPADLAKESLPLMVTMAEAAAAAMQAAYPKVTGRLAGSVKVKTKVRGVRAQVLLANVAPYALAWEYGRGAGDSAGKVFVPITRAAKRRVEGVVAAILESHGAKVDQSS